MTKKEDRRIIVLPERWVFIGEYHEATPTAPAHLTDASCIRIWGTVAGLGEIALRGPTKNTKLDPCGTLVIHQSPVFTLRCTY